jgi:hypothetical protein
VQVYGNVPPEVTALCEARSLPLHVFPWRPEMASAGVRRDAVYLVRPDGYVALAVEEEGAEAIASYFAARRLATTIHR